MVDGEVLRQSARMDTIDFAQARAAHLALKEFFAAHPKGPLDPALLVDVQALCRAAERAVPDLDCRRAIRSIETYSELLIARDSPSRGADFVRLRVQNALASFRSKLKAIEAGEATLS
jgi:hypothetical protein